MHVPLCRRKQAHVCTVTKTTAHTSTCSYALCTQSLQNTTTVPIVQPLPLHTCFTAYGVIHNKRPIFSVTTRIVASAMGCHLPPAHHSRVVGLSVPNWVRSHSNLP